MRIIHQVDLVVRLQPEAFVAKPNLVLRKETRSGEAFAIALEAAATVVARRGAPDQGAQLAELSARFTADHDAGASRRRRLTAADFHGRAGGSKRETELLRELESELAAGPERAEVLSRLTTGLVEDVARLEQALVEAGGATPVTGELHQFWPRMKNYH